MSLCRFYPPASDRMAIIWSLMPIQNAIVLEYGPAGTTHFGGGLYSSLGIRLSQSLFTTHISEDDVIMGDVTRLEKIIPTDFVLSISFWQSKSQRIVIKKRKRLIRSSVRRLVPTESVPTCGSYSS